MTFDNRKNQKFFLESSDTVRIQTQDSFILDDRVSPNKRRKEERPVLSENVRNSDIMDELDLGYGVKNAQSNKSSPAHGRFADVKVSTSCSTTTNRDSKNRLNNLKKVSPKKKVKTPSFGQIEMETIVD